MDSSDINNTRTEIFQKDSLDFKGLQITPLLPEHHRQPTYYHHITQPRSMFIWKEFDAKENEVKFTHIESVSDSEN